MTKSRVTLLRSAWMVLLTVACFARPQERGTSRPDPGELVRKAVRNEITASRATNDRFMFRSTKTTPKGSTTKLFVESQEGTAGLVVAYNGKSLTPDQRRTEKARVERFLNNPAELKKKRKQEREDEERTLRIMRAIPDAFLFEYAGEEQGSEGIGRPGDPLVQLKFRPNPRYEPPSREEQVLTGMQGTLMVDAARYRIASIDGTLFREVNFGWGILGHLDRGGHFLVQQREIGDNRWEVSRMTLDFTGKALLVKNLVIRSTEVFSDFKRVPPDLTFAQALELLEKEETATVENPTSSKLALK
jgi:hypothetical protein